MAAPMTKTRHPGIYKRGSRYVVRFRANGKRYAESCRTLDDALKLKRSRESARDKGELDQLTQTRSTLREFAGEWVERYQGNGRRGFTDDTRDEYRRDLNRYVFPLLGDLRVGSISPRSVSEWIAWLCDEKEQGRRRGVERREREKNEAKRKKIKDEPLRLSDATVRRILSPLRACLATASREGLIRSNPCDGVPLPNRPQIVSLEEPERAKALTREQLSMFLRVVPKKHRLMFRFLASTGVRWSEFAALPWSDLSLDGSTPHVRIRRALAKKQPKGQEPRYKPPKSRHGVRSIPLDATLCRELRAARKGAADDALVFPAGNGRPLRQENVRRRILKIAAEEAGVPWIGFHTFRHTCASLLFAAGRNVKQVQRWLGHHSPGFTLDTYVHLLDDGVGGGLDLDSELKRSGSLSRLEKTEGESGPKAPAILLAQRV